MLWKSSNSLVSISQVGGKSVRRWKASYANGREVCFGTLGHLTYIEHKDERRREKGRDKLNKMFPHDIQSCFHPACLEMFILQGSTKEVQYNLNEYERVFYDHLIS